MGGLLNTYYREAAYPMPEEDPNCETVGTLSRHWTLDITDTASFCLPKTEKRQIYRLGPLLWTPLSHRLTKMLKKDSEGANKPLSWLSRNNFPTMLTSDAEDYCAFILSKEPRPFRRQSYRKGKTRE